MSVGPVRESAVARTGAFPSSHLDRTKPDVVDRPSPFARMLEGLGREVEDGEALVRSAIRMPHGGANIDPADLIALQAGVYRYGEAVDLASRLIDRASGSVKTIVQAQ